MPPRSPDTFLDTFLEFDCSVRSWPRWLSWLLSAVLSAISLALGIVQPLALMLLWACALFLAATGVLGWRALAVGAGMSNLGLVLLAQQGAVIEGLRYVLMGQVLVALCGVLLARACRLRAYLARTADQARRLRQLHALREQGDGECLLEIDVQGRLKNISASAERMLGPAARRDASWLGLWQGVSELAALRAFDKALSGQPSRFSGLSTASAGKSRHWDVTLAPAQDAEGRIESILALARDVTALRDAERALQACQADGAALLDTLSQGFYQLDRKWQIVRANTQAALRILQNRGLRVGSCMLEVFPAGGNDLLTALRDVMNLGFPRHFQWRSPWDNGWYRVDAYPLAEGIQVFLQDISSQVTAVRQLQAAKARLQLTQQVGRFADWSLDLATHELQLSEQAGGLLNLPVSSHQEALVRALHAQDRLRFVSALLDVVEGAGTLDIRVRLADQQRHFQFVGTVIHPQDNPEGLLVGSVQDITEQQARERALFDAEAFNRSIIDALPQQVAVLDERGRVVACNRAWNADPLAGVIAARDNDYLGFCRDRAAGGETYMQALLEGVEALMEGIGEPFSLPYERVKGSQSRHFQAFAMLMGTGQPQVLIMHQDMTNNVRLRQRLSRSETRLRAMVEHFPHVFWVYDIDAQAITYASPAFEQLWGIPCEVLYQNPEVWLDRVPEQDRRLARSYYRAAGLRPQPTEIEHRLLSAQGDTLWIRNRAFPSVDGSGRVVRVVGIAENITEAHAMQQRLFRVANFDAVTGLPNQNRFTERLEKACQQARQAQEELCALVISLGRLAWVGQCFGQRAGEQLMRQLCERYTRALAGRGDLARLEGERFAVLLGHEEAGQLESLATALLEATEEPLQVDGEAVRLMACIGISRFPRDGEDAEALLRHAGAASHSLLLGGKRGFRAYNRELHRASRDRFRLTSDIDEAVRQRQFILHFQPKLALATGRVIGAEALIRWEHPQHGVIPPLRFMQLLLESGHMQAVGRWSIDQALAQLAAWRREHGLEICVAVNLSSQQLEAELVDYVRAALARHAVRPGNLELELIDPFEGRGETAVTVVGQLKALGVKIALDGLGSGAATLASVRAFDPNIVKINWGFVEGLDEQSADRTVARAVIDMAHALGMTVVAEGVEREAQARVLRTLGCDQIQGFWVSAPLAAEAFAARYLVQP